MNMNKEEFIKELEEKLKYSKEQCILINDILENNFFISKKNKDKIIEELMEKLDIKEQEANNVYEKAIEIVKEEVKHKLKNPFKSKD